ncbi:MAG: gliding motility-associated C-terminal domain-containing protein [Bacteroidota bacterium]
MKKGQLYCVVMLLLMSNWLVAQQSYNSCNQALELCPNQVFSVSNLSANTTVCPTCEDNFTFCFTPNNTIWLQFSTNVVGGDVSIDFSNLVFQTGAGQGTAIQAALLQASVPCDPASYTNLGNCESNQAGNFLITATALPANTNYYIVISGANGVSSPAECTLDVAISGTGVDQIAPSFNIIYPATVCANQLVSAYVAMSNCPDSSAISWYINGTLVAVTSDTIFQTTNLQNNDILSAECTCYQNCPLAVSALTAPIVVNTIAVNAGADQSIFPGDTIQLQATTSGSILTWTPSFLLSNDSILNPFAFPNETTLFTLSVTDVNGCIFTDGVLITVPQLLMIPNTFSPNNDGRNDTWVIPGIENFPDCTIYITNRWGQEVFQTTAYSAQTAWRGESNSGNVLTEGVYFYVINLKDEADQQFKGSLTLIR